MRAAAALLFACLLCGCSMVRFAYDNADAYLRWRAGNYLDVHGEQADELDASIQAFLDWHRAQALPQYARLADEAAQRLGDGLSPQDLVWGYDSLVVQARESLRTAAQRIAPLLERLDDEQIAHLEQRLADDNRRFAKQYLRGPERKRRERRAERIAERLEDWVGRLSQAQRARVRRYSESVPLLSEMRDRDNRRLQAGLLELVRAREAEERLAQFVLDWERGRDPAYARAVAASRRELFTMLLELDRTLSPEQRERAIAHLRRYAAEFRLLAARP